MKRVVKSDQRGGAIALALTWDGARWPVRFLPEAARRFLAGRARGKGRLTVPSAGEVSKLMARDEVREIRVCWVPRLKGGSDVLAEPFTTEDGLRVKFAAARIVEMGDVLGVVYRRMAQ